MQPPNPFSPGFGQPPPFLAGRERHLAYVSFLVRQFEAHGRAESVVWSGARGMGKTVLAQASVEDARRRGWLAAYTQVRRGEGAGESFGRLLEDLAGRPGRGRLRRLAAMVEAVEVSLPGGAAVGATMRQPRPEALRALPRRRGEEAHRRHKGVLLAMDEAQDLGERGLAQVLGALADVRSLPVAVVFCGLTSLPRGCGRQGPSRSVSSTTRWARSLRRRPPRPTAGAQRPPGGASSPTPWATWSPGHAVTPTSCSSPGGRPGR